MASLYWHFTKLLATSLKSVINLFCDSYSNPIPILPVRSQGVVKCCTYLHG